MATRKKPAASEQAATEQPTTELVTLSAAERAKQVMKVEATRLELTALAGRFTNIKAITNDDGLAEAKAALRVLVSTRTTIEKVGKAARDDANKFGKAVIAEERGLIDLIKPEEDRIGALVTTEESRRAEAERVAREEEQRRAELITQAFARIRSLPSLAVGRDVAGIDQLLAEAQAMLDDHSHIPDDLQAAARYEANLAVNELKAVRDRRVQADKDAEELAEFRRRKAEEEAQRQRDEAAALAAQPVADAPVADDDLPPGAALAEEEDDELPPGSVDLEQEERVPGGYYGGYAQRAPSGPAVELFEPMGLLPCSRAALQLLLEAGYGDTKVYSNLREAIADEERKGVA